MADFTVMVPLRLALSVIEVHGPRRIATAFNRDMVKKRDAFDAVWWTRHSKASAGSRTSASSQSIATFKFAPALRVNQIIAMAQLRRAFCR